MSFSRKVCPTARPAGVGAVRRACAARRRGVALLMVLALVSIALAVCYGSLRVQTASVSVNQNHQGASRARQAAVTGLTIALGKMHQSSWAGVDVPVDGTIDAYTSYSVSVTTGDDSLSPGDPQYSEFPFRVTLLSTGTSSEPGSAGNPSSHKIRAVVKLVPRELSSEPSGWAASQQYAFYQGAANRDIVLELPARITGPVKLLGRLVLADEYPTTSSSKSRYLSDLNQMRLASMGDHRPFSGPLTMPTSLTSSSTLSLLTNELGVSVTNAGGSDSPFALSGQTSSYKLYPGGKSYTITQTSSTISNLTQAPDPLTNPIGLQFRSNKVTLANNVSITGTVWSGTEIELTGTNVNLQAAELPPLEGSTQPVRLPALIAEDISVASGSYSIVTGNVLAWDALEVKTRNSHTVFAVSGRATADELQIKKRSSWATFPWSLFYTTFLTQQGLPTGTPYFPVYVSSFAPYEAPIVIEPSATAYREHYQTNFGPIYVPKSGDSGLFWDLLEWTDLGPSSN